MRGDTQVRSGIGALGTVPIVVRREARPDPLTLAQWDRLVEASTGTDVTQLAAWARIRARENFSPLYLLAYQGHRVVGGALFLRRRLLGALSIGYLPYGPLVARDAPNEDTVTAAMIAAITQLAQSWAMTFVQPPERAEHISEALLARGFRISGAGIAPAGSYRLDLTRPLEDIRAGFSKRLKSWTNRWQAQGVHVRRGAESDLTILASLMAHTGSRQSFGSPSLRSLGTLYRELESAGHAALFIGEVDGRPVSADLVTMIGDTVRGRKCGFDASGRAGKLSVPAAVRWELIKWAKAEGYRWLDFGGLPEPMLDDMLVRGIRNSDEWPNAHRSKLAFRGEPFRYPQPVEMIRPTALRWVYAFAQGHPQLRRVIATGRRRLQGRPTVSRRGTAPASVPGADDAPW